MASTLTSAPSSVPDSDAWRDATRHPRPLLRRSAWRSLDGTWQFRYGHGTVGELPGHAAATTYPLQVVVPFAPESPASGIGDGGFHPVVGYRREIDVPESWRDRRVLLHFGAVDRDADVWVNAQHVVRHEGGYTPFSADITDALRFDGRDVVEVRAEDDPLDLGAPRGKQDWEREPHSIWYPRTTGIWQSVWIEAVAAIRVEGVRTTTDLAAFALDLVVDFTGVAHGTTVDAGLAVRVVLSRDGERVVDERIAVTGQRVERRLHLPDPGIDDARDRWLWTPEHPHLLDLEITLFFADEVIDEVLSYTALRTVEVSDDAFVLNGRPYGLRLVLDQGYWPDGHLTAPSSEALERDVALTKALGFNGVRKHQKLEDPRYLAWADRLGLLVWAELPSAYAFGPRTLERLGSLLFAAVRRDAGHPSLVAWVVANESWGFPDLPRRADQRHAVQALVHMAKALDPSRPVVGNDGWEVVAGDLVDVHDYAADPDVLVARYGDPERLARTLERHRPSGRRVFLDAELVAVDTRRGGRPVLLTEFGGVRIARRGPGWGYAQVADAEALLERYRALLAAVHESDVLAGFCYTQLTDTFQEQNGLLTMDRRPKADTAALALATRGTGGRAS
ncbi:MAG: glycoside hydrolase family 2 [Trueperaceae bacterium]|nr:glycoside hydrolase family 2 [Trueperaceae bacterium]